jgi:aspartate aminotransferase
VVFDIKVSDVAFFFYNFFFLCSGSLRKNSTIKQDLMFPASCFRAVEKSQTLVINEQSRQLEASGREVFKFGFGQSPFPPLPSAIAELEAQAHQKAYAPTQGIPELREAVAAFHREAEGLDVTSEQVIVGSGSKILIYAAMAAFSHADVLIPAPAWVSYVPQAKLLGHTPLRVASHFEGRWRMTPDALRVAIAQKSNTATPSILIFNHPGNPDGLCYTDDELTALASIMREHNVLAISDEIYGLLHHTGGHKSLALFYPEGTIVTGGLSKWCGAGGWRLGVALLPRSIGVGESDFKNVMTGICSETYSCAPLPIQLAAVKAYHWQSPELQSYLGFQRKLISFLGAWCAKTLREEGGIRVHTPQGGFYLFIDFTPYQEILTKKCNFASSGAMCQALLVATGVAVLPADAFGMDKDYMAARLAFVEFNGADALAAVAALGDAPIPEDEFLGTVFAKTAKGIRSIAQWVKSL